MADFKAKKELAQEILAELACNTCQDVPGPIGDRKNRYACSNGHMVCEACRFQECSCKSKIVSGPLSNIEKILDKLQWHHCGHFTISTKKRNKIRFITELNTLKSLISVEF